MILLKVSAAAASLKCEESREYRQQCSVSTTCMTSNRILAIPAFLIAVLLADLLWLTFNVIGSYPQ